MNLTKAYLAENFFYHTLYYWTLSDAQNYCPMSENEEIYIVSWMTDLNLQNFKYI